jgi:hypothetical protein
VSEFTRDDVEVLSTDVRGFRGSAWHIKVGAKHFAISAISNEFGTETMAFAADEHGKVESFTDLAAVHAYDHEACIAALLDSLAGAR